MEEDRREKGEVRGKEKGSEEIEERMSQAIIPHISIPQLYQFKIVAQYNLTAIDI